MQNQIKQLPNLINNGDFYAIARAITLIENELTDAAYILGEIKHSLNANVIGITGPPGAGKSTLVNSLLEHWISHQKKIAVIAVDPSSPFNYGALLGDRMRMSNFYNNSHVYIRSLATRGALGGLNARIIEITELLKSAPFDMIIIETVGVGQSEVEIAGLADCTVVTLVPEAGDELQTMKAGIMEIADVFVVNKADREEANALYNTLRIMTHQKANGKQEIPVLKTIATKNIGIDTLADFIEHQLASATQINEKKIILMAEKSWQLIEKFRMENLTKAALITLLKSEMMKPNFNLFNFSTKLAAGENSDR